MALQSISDIGPGKTLSPNSELARINAIHANRRLYNGDFSALKVPNIDTDAEIPGLRLNWFRRIARFYPEFVLGETPVVTVADNARLTQLLADRGKRLWSAISAAIRDRIRFGYGIVASHPEDATALWCVDPESHYEVVDDLGTVTADLILRERPTSDGQNGYLDIYVYPVNAPAERRVHRFSAGIVGERIATIPLPPRAGRQVAYLPEVGERLSMYEDIAGSIGELSRSMTSLARTIRRNARPHLYGPEGMLTVDEDGRAVIDPDGMYLPIPPGDDSIAPGYLTWDAKLDAIQFDVKQHTDIVLAMTGLSRVLFEPESKTGVTSGVALRRLLLPFVAKLATMKTENDCLFENVLAMITRNIVANRGEAYQYATRDISISYSFEKLFTDDADNPNRGNE